MSSFPLGVISTTAIRSRPPVAPVEQVQNRNLNAEEKAANKKSNRLDRSRRDPVQESNASEGGHKGKRLKPDATEEAPAKPRIKFRPPSKDRPGEPVFQEDGPDRDGTSLGGNVDVVA